MKKTAFFGILVGVMAAGSAFAETAFEGQPVSSVAIVVESARSIVPVAFGELSSDESLNVSVSNILSTANLKPGDQVFLYAEAGYQSWTLNEDKIWEANALNVKAIGESAQMSEPGMLSDAMRPALGTGFWLYRPNRLADELKLPYFIYGTYAATTRELTVTGKKNLLGNPTIEEKAPTISSPADGDMLAVSTGSGLVEYTYTDTYGWSHLSGSNFVDSPTPPAIAPGVGFWYTTKSKSVTFTW